MCTNFNNKNKNYFPLKHGEKKKISKINTNDTNLKSFHKLKKYENKNEQ